MTMEDIRFEGQAGRLGAMITTVVVDGQEGKEYRLPTEDEIKRAAEAENELRCVFADVPFGLPQEPLPSKEALGFRVPLYGFDQWRKLFTPRQLLVCGALSKYTRAARDMMRDNSYPPEWVEALEAYLAIVLDKTLDYNSTVCTWHNSREIIRNTFARFALPITWNFTELAAANTVGGSYTAQLDWVARYIEYGLSAVRDAEVPTVLQQSAIRPTDSKLDLVVTDPPYYDAIPYSDLMDFFYIWLGVSQNAF